MAVERASTSLVRYLGATVKANTNQGNLSNLVTGGQGGEVARNASVRRLANQGQTSATIKVADYQAALGYLEQRGVGHVVAKTMATVFVDAARSQNISVMSLLETTNTEALSLTNPNTFNRVNQLRDLTSQLSSSRPINNANSTKARVILP